jgi:drug/metabolite transporter (DMT)-like permease
VLGTAAYTLATTKGSIAVAGGVLSTMMVATAVIAWLLHGERLNRAQWIAILVVCGLLLGLGLA